jgi:hypothetical protein
MMALLVIIALGLFDVVLCASRNKPHSHQGVLQPYDGRPLPQRVTPQQQVELEKGEAVRLCVHAFCSRGVLHDWFAGYVY